MRSRYFAGIIGMVMLAVVFVAVPAQAQEDFGEALAIAGEEVFIGDPATSSASGRVYIFGRDVATEAWIEKRYVLASDAAMGDAFGGAVAAAGDWLIAGAPGVDAAYIFQRGQDGWTEVARLTPSDGMPGDQFGSAVAVSGDTVVVGAPDHDGQTGAAYIFQRDDEGWTEVARLTGSDAVPGDLFGFAVAIDGDDLLVGAQYADNRTGAVYAFQHNGSGQWTELDRFIGSETQVGDRFGRSIALSDGVALIGAPVHGGGAGQAYIVQRDGGGWMQQAILEDDDAYKLLGWSVALDGEVAWLGAPWQNGEAGAVYVFQRDATTQEWIPHPPLDGKARARLGWHVAVRENLGLAQADQEDAGAGAVYLYERGHEDWAAPARLVGVREGLAPIVGEAVTCANGQAVQFPCSSVNLLAFLPRQDIGGIRGIRLNDIWGWTDPETGKEYALVGRMDGTAFVDVSDPVNPVYLGELPLPDSARVSVWRDIKTYADHAFIVADNAGDHGMQVFDLTQLRTVTTPPVTFTETARYLGFTTAHNVVVNEDTGYAYGVGLSGIQDVPQGCGPGYHAVDIRDPAQPTFAGCFSSTVGRGYTHDAQCVVYDGPDAEHRGKEICIGADEDGLSITDVTGPDKASPVQLSTATYPNVAYAHQGWLTDDHRYFFLDDELDESNIPSITRTRTLIWDVSDLDDPVLEVQYEGTASTIDHNQYVVGNLLYQANYTSGLRILDISDPLDPQEVAFFDTVPGSEAVSFDGAWSVYPFFESGTVIVSSQDEGLFVLQPSEAVVKVSTGSEADVPNEFILSAAYPNPFNPQTTLTLTLERPQPVRVAAYDALGRAVAVLHAGPLPAGAHPLVFDARALPSGVYAIRAAGDTRVQTQMVMLLK